jgi:two-component system alkaline phosphatase synthesis response regulator PhoP
MLYQNKNEAVNRDDIIEKIWGEDKYPSQRTVDNYIVKLRKWCETDQQKKVEIQSIRSIGYKLHIIN